MTADALTKLYGPLQHWQRIAFYMGESEPLAIIGDLVILRYRKDKHDSPTIIDLPDEDPHLLPQLPYYFI